MFMENRCPTSCPAILTCNTKINTAFVNRGLLQQYDDREFIELPDGTQVKVSAELEQNEIDLTKLVMGQFAITAAASECVTGPQPKMAVRLPWYQYVDWTGNTWGLQHTANTDAHAQSELSTNLVCRNKRVKRELGRLPYVAPLASRPKL